MRVFSFRRHKVWACIAALVVVAAALLGRPAIHLLVAAWRDVDELRPSPAGYVDDASRMNATHVTEVWTAPGGAKPQADGEAARELAALLRRAGEEGKRVSIAGARHTMGGHTIAADGIYVDMTSLKGMTLDAERKVLTVQAGARWSEVIALLDRHDLSVGVMQSNNSFSVGGSLSCNCHGWSFGKPSIASTVESLRLMLADGSIVRCSREENEELFSLALGGYGLFGIILDANLRVVPNERYRLEQFVVPITEGFSTFEARVNGRDDVAMCYARLGIAPQSFLQDAIINVLYVDPAADGALPPLMEARSTELRRRMFRGSVGSDYGKKLRWSAEAKLQPQLNERYFSRNQLLNEGVEVFQNRSAGSTDILHEYFVPREGTVRFVSDMARIVRAHGQDLLNVTVRYVATDEDTLLRYADRELLAFVMLFHQAATAEGDARMEAMTRELIDASLAAGGRYYLPYRLHASREQFGRAYPQGEEFFRLKRKYDPEELFQNQFYLKYGAKL